MWRIQNHFALIDLSNEFFIVWLTNLQDYEIALFNGPWITGDNYLQIQRRVPDFVDDEAMADKLCLGQVSRAIS